MALHFHLAVPNLFPFRSYDFIEECIIDDKNIKTIFIELSPIANIAENYDADPNIYSINRNKLFEVFDFGLLSDYPIKYKLGYIVGYSILYSYKYIYRVWNKKIHNFIFQLKNT